MSNVTESGLANGRPELNDVEGRINAAREILRPSAVRHDHVPMWFRMAIVRGLRPPRGVSDGWAALQYAAERFDLSHRVFDHWGSIAIDGQAVFVTEPYGLSSASVAALKSFSDAIGVEFTIEANSWHFPGSTIRIVFWQSGLLTRKACTMLPTE